MAARSFPSPAGLAASAEHTARLRTYLGDMLAPYDLALSPDGLAPVRGQSYGEMAEALLADLDPSTVDLLVLATDVPDVTPGRATATYLSHVCPGGPMAYGVSDQGPAAAYTGTKLISNAGPAVLLVLEQAELPYDPGVPVRLPARHAGVGLYLDGGAAPDVRVLPDVDGPEAALPLLASLSDATPAVVVLGAALSTLDVKADRVVLADPDQPMTGSWAALAEVVADGGPVVLADYDPVLRYLCVAAFPGA